MEYLSSGDFGERCREDLVERFGQVWPELGEARRRLVQVSEDDRELAVARERTRAGQALE